jgi:hypothetical protein
MYLMMWIIVELLNMLKCLKMIQSILKYCHGFDIFTNLSPKVVLKKIQRFGDEE